jgi:hypothetical protein
VNRYRFKLAPARERTTSAALPNPPPSSSSSSGARRSPPFGRASPSTRFAATRLFAAYTMSTLSKYRCHTGSAPGVSRIDAPSRAPRRNSA